MEIRVARGNTCDTGGSLQNYMDVETRMLRLSMLLGELLNVRFRPAHTQGVVTEFITIATCTFKEISSVHAIALSLAIFMHNLAYSSCVVTLGQIALSLSPTKSWQPNVCHTKSGPCSQDSSPATFTSGRPATNVADVLFDLVLEAQARAVVSALLAPTACFRTVHGTGKESILNSNSAPRQH